MNDARELLSEDGMATVMLCSQLGLGEEHDATALTLKEWNGPSASVAAQYDPNVATVEYRVTLKTQNPDEIAIPSSIQATTKPAQMPSNEKPKTNLIPWIIGAAVLVGLLVYFALRPYRKASSPSGRERTPDLSDWLAEAAFRMTKGELISACEGAG